LPVALIAGFGQACELAASEAGQWRAKWTELRGKLIGGVARLGAKLNGDQERCLPNTVSMRIPGLDSEAAMVALKDVVAVSNGSACTSSAYSPSHVLVAMGLGKDEVQGAVRMSWCHMTEEPDIGAIVARLAPLIEVEWQRY